MYSPPSKQFSPDPIPVPQVIPYLYGHCVVPSRCSGERSLSSGKVIAGWGSVQGFSCDFLDKKRRLHKQHKKREQSLSFRFCAEPYVHDFEIQSVKQTLEPSAIKTRRFRPPVASILYKTVQTIRLWCEDRASRFILYQTKVRLSRVVRKFVR